MIPQQQADAEMGMAAPGAPARAPPAACRLLTHSRLLQVFR